MGLNRARNRSRRGKPAPVPCSNPDAECEKNRRIWFLRDCRAALAGKLKDQHIGMGVPGDVLADVLGELLREARAEECETIRDEICPLPETVVPTLYFTYRAEQIRKGKLTEGKPLHVRKGKVR